MRTPFKNSLPNLYFFVPSKTNFSTQNKTLQMLVSEFLKGEVGGGAAGLPTPSSNPP
jgi:hypothetical protein